MIISDSKKIKDIQAEFSGLFPHLQLRFYKKAHAPKEGSSAKEEWATDLALSEIRSVSSDGELNISEDMTVSELEMAFENLFGLHVQVFRESTGGIWLQTTATDDWTLGAQNDRAKNLLLAR